MMRSRPTGFLRHIRACNRCDISRYRPLLIGDRRVGWIAAETARILAHEPGTFRVADQAVELLPDTPTARTAAVGELAARLSSAGDLPKLRGEMFEVRPRWHEPALFELDRGIVPSFGTRGFGVHLNGFFGDPSQLWIGRRAPDKRVEPDKLDNVVAGGIGDGHGVIDTLLKEAEEEASMPRQLAAQARPVSLISYRTEREGGLRDDVLFVYDLALPAEFTPVNTDGEFAGFTPMDAQDVLTRVVETDDFKFNVALVIIDFGLRHGLIGPDHLEYLELCVGLHRPLD